jgi:DNA mismatch repair protein MutL
LSITSRPAGAELGCRVDVRFGSVLKVHEMGCAQGTVVEVADLFANVPARRKFLKSANTELAHIDEVIRSYALISCHTSFSYQVNGRELLDLPVSHGAAERRVRQLLADAPELIAIADAEGVARPEIRVSGYLVPPEQASGRAGRLWTFVNGRFIKDRLVNHAVTEGLAGFLLRGGRPAGVIHLHLPPAGVDVNVHPTKQEVRFSEGNLVHNKIVAAIWRSMEAYQTRLKGELFGSARKQAMPFVAAAASLGGAPVLEVREPEPQVVLGVERAQDRTEVVAPVVPGVGMKGSAWMAEVPGPKTLAFERALPGKGEQPVPRATATTTPASPPALPRPPLPMTARPCPAAPPPFQGNARLDEFLAPPPADRPVPGVGGMDHGPPALSSLAVANQGNDTVPAPSRLRYLGQLFDTYLLCQAEDGLVAIDQHAVQERLIFEELKGHYSAGTMPGQILMFPVMVDLLPNEVEAVAQHGSELERLGLELQEFGGDTVVIKAVPAGLGHLSPAEILGGILGRFLEDQPTNQEAARLDEVLAGMACKAAIKAGHALTPMEVQHLLERIERAGIFSHCPHGRSVVKRFSRAEVERWFQRG